MFLSSCGVSQGFVYYLVALWGVMCGPGNQGVLPKVTGARCIFRQKEVKTSHKDKNVAGNTKKGSNPWYCLWDDEHFLNCSDRKVVGSESQLVESFVSHLNFQKFHIML